MQHGIQGKSDEVANLEAKAAKAAKAEKAAPTPVAAKTATRSSKRKTK